MAETGCMMLRTTPAGMSMMPAEATETMLSMVAMMAAMSAASSMEAMMALAHVAVTAMEAMMSVAVMVSAEAHVAVTAASSMEAMMSVAVMVSAEAHVAVTAASSMEAMMQRGRDGVRRSPCGHDRHAVHGSHDERGRDGVRRSPCGHDRHVVHGSHDERGRDGVRRSPCGHDRHVVHEAIDRAWPRWCPPKPLWPWKPPKPLWPKPLWPPPRQLAGPSCVRRASPRMPLGRGLAGWFLGSGLFTRSLEEENRPALLAILELEIDLESLGRLLGFAFAAFPGAGGTGPAKRRRLRFLVAVGAGRRDLSSPGLPVPAREPEPSA